MGSYKGIIDSRYYRNNRGNSSSPLFLANSILNICVADDLRTCMSEMIHQAPDKLVVLVFGCGIVNVTWQYVDN